MASRLCSELVSGDLNDRPDRVMHRNSRAPRRYSPRPSACIVSRPKPQAALPHHVGIGSGPFGTRNHNFDRLEGTRPGGRMVVFQSIDVVCWSARGSYESEGEGCKGVLAGKARPVRLRSRRNRKGLGTDALRPVGTRSWRPGSCYCSFMESDSCRGSLQDGKHGPGLRAAGWDSSPDPPGLRWISLARGPGSADQVAGWPLIHLVAQGTTALWM